MNYWFCYGEGFRDIKFIEIVVYILVYKGMVLIDRLLMRLYLVSLIMRIFLLVVFCFFVGKFIIL